MLHDWGVIAAAFGYIGFLFFVASYGDRLSLLQRGRASALIYPRRWRSIAPWTFFGRRDLPPVPAPIFSPSMPARSG